MYAWKYYPTSREITLHGAPFPSSDGTLFCFATMHSGRYLDNSPIKLKKCFFHKILVIYGTLVTVRASPLWNVLWKVFEACQAPCCMGPTTTVILLQPPAPICPKCPFSCCALLPQGGGIEAGSGGVCCFLLLFLPCFLSRGLSNIAGC